VVGEGATFTYCPAPQFWYGEQFGRFATAVKVFAPQSAQVRFVVALPAALT
jgi:hypothetical protein